jgi:hypothetical protein
MEFSQVVQPTLHERLLCKNTHILHNANMYQRVSSNGMEREQGIGTETDLESNAAEGEDGEV